VSESIPIPRRLVDELRKRGLNEVVREVEFWGAGV
jgi:hypothetical protein